MNKRKCKYCKEYFPVDESVKINAGWFCSIEHAINFANDKTKKQRQKEQNRVKIERKREYYSNDKRHQTKLAQKAFNAYIRLRDKSEPCISCQRHHKGQYHAGHYRTTKSAPQLRFNGDNVNKQCSACNVHLSGNIGEYRINLIRKIGVDRVEELETNNEIRKYTIEEIIEIKKKYQKLILEG